MVSRCYRLERMPGQFTDNEKNGLQIEWRERITVHYRLIPFEKEINSCLLSACSFAEEPPTIVECALTSAADYLCLEKAWYKFEVSMNGPTYQLAHLFAFGRQNQSSHRSLAHV